MKGKVPKPRNPIAEEMIRSNRKAGPHHTREDDVRMGRSRKQKHKNKSPERSGDSHLGDE